VTIRTAEGRRIELTLPEYRLALLWLVDFAANWEALEYATTLVPDGPAKLALIRERLRPVAAHLPALASRGVDSLEMLAARFWFRQEDAKNP
jgi:hypothetical protein